MHPAKPSRRTLLLSLPTLAVARPAQAHAVLLDSFPLPNGTMPAGPGQLRLRFNSRIDVGRSRFTLRTPDNREAALALKPGATADIVLADVIIAPGKHVIAWQVLAVDGHITRGVVAFMAIAA